MRARLEALIEAPRTRRSSREPAAPRVLLGITGPPGAGKSTLAELLVPAGSVRVAVVPMDGFHLADPVLARLGRSDRKGAPDTFDRDGFRVAVERLRQGDHVYLPAFHRELEAAVAGEIEIGPLVELVVVEGNYLLYWPEVAALLDEVWYLDPPAPARVDALVARHVRFGRTEQQARAWVGRSDEANAALVAAGRDRADLVLTNLFRTDPASRDVVRTDVADGPW